jgi:hypothetical protein
VGAKLIQANLHGADLSAANVSVADLSVADLSEADLSRANLSWAKLSAAKLIGAKLIQANLHGADLSAANVSRADVNAARASGTKFADVDLSAVNGLENVVHGGPSTVGIDTVCKSGGKIPVAFLRGCGVTDELIAYIGSMVGRAIEFDSCFISCSTRDREFAERLHADLQAKGVRCWIAPHVDRDFPRIQDEIDEAIRLHDRMLLILSEHSMNSYWVKPEIANARQREEREKKDLLFPITLAPMEEVKKWKLFDADLGIDSAREVRECFIPDFSNWKDHDSYQTAFQRLVSDLKAEASK